MKDPKSPSPVIIGGVDTHKELHVAAVVDATDTVLATESLSTTRAGYRAMLRWMRSYGETRQVDEARTNGRFHRYVVDNVRQGNPPPSDSLTFTATCWPASSNEHDHRAT